MKILSPSLEIYRFPITAISSILNRITGLAATGYFLGFGIICLFEKDKEALKIYNNNKKITNYMVLTPMVYHTLGGIRHLIWDHYPVKFLNNKQVKNSSLILFYATFPITYFCEKYML